MKKDITSHVKAIFGDDDVRKAYIIQLDDYEPKEGDEIYPPVSDCSIEASWDFDIIVELKNGKSSKYGLLSG